MLDYTEGVHVGYRRFLRDGVEPLFWMGCAYLFIRIVKTGNPKLWVWFGILAGVGLENKYSMLIFGAGSAMAVSGGMSASPHLSLLGALLAVSLVAAPWASSVALRIAYD